MRRLSLAEETAQAPWVKSSFSTNPNGCLQIKRLSTHVVIGDTKNPDGPTLTVANAHWDDFLHAIRTGSTTVTGALHATPEPDGGFALNSPAADSPILRYTRSERVAFLRGVSNGELRSSDLHKKLAPTP